MKRIRFVCPKCGKEILSANYGSGLRIDDKPVQNDMNIETFCGNCNQRCVRADTNEQISVLGGAPKRPPRGGTGRIIT